MPSLETPRDRFRGIGGTTLVAVLTAFLAAPGQAILLAQEAPAAQAAADAQESPKLSNDQLDSLVAPIALYPDPLLAQCLVASTYPLDIVQAQQWLANHPTLKGDDLVNEAQNQDWDPSVQALVSLPDALKRLSENIKWTTDLGDAFLAQQGDVMDAVQRLRARAKNSGKLASTQQQKVETTAVESKTVIEIQPASTEVIYVPSYSPTVIWGAPVYPYPVMYYPSYYADGAWLGFGVGIAIGIDVSGGWGWGWGCGWGYGNTIYINNNNHYHHHHNSRNNTNRSGNSNWQHNSQQRGGVPYRDHATANRYGGGARGDSTQARQSQAQSRQSQGGREAGAGSMDRSGGASGSRGGASPGSIDRGGGASGSRGGASPGSIDRSGGGRSGSSGAFGGSSSGSSARSSSARGASSMGGFHGGGGGPRGGRR